MRTVLGSVNRYAVVTVIIMSLCCVVEIEYSAAALLGADTVLSHIDKALGGEKQQTDPNEDKAIALMKDINTFKINRTKMSVDAAVDAWLGLYDRFWMLPQSALAKAKEINPALPGDENRLSTAALLSAFPQPAAWDGLKKRVLSRPVKGPQDTVLRILVLYLTKDKKNLDKAVADLRTTAGGDFRTKYMLDSIQLKRFSSGGSESGKGVVSSFESYLQSLQLERPEGLLVVNVPDIVSLAGEEKARSLIKQALTVPGLTLRVPSGERTLDVAKNLVISNSAALIEPQWGLVTSIADIELYEAMIKRFPDKDDKKQDAPMFQDPKAMRFNFGGRGDESRRRARILYTFGLIAGKRVGDAVEQAKGMQVDDLTSGDFDRVWQSFEKITYAEPLANFCAGLLQARPDAPLWAKCGVVAPMQAARENLVAIAEAAGDKTDVSIGTRMSVREHQVEVLLAMDRIDDAISLMRTLVAMNAVNESQTEQQLIARIKYRMLARMCEIGRLLDRKDLVKESAEKTQVLIGAFGNNLVTNWDEKSAGGAVKSIIDTLIRGKEYEKAEAIVLAIMQATMKSPQIGKNQDKREALISSGTLGSMQIRLMEIYDQAGRYQDMMTLLDRSPWWGAPDLIYIAEMDEQLPPLAAKALHRAGRDVEAVQILKGHLYGYPGNDAAYQVLVDISGASLMPWLDELYERDRFEERPLIWKALLLQQQGKLEEAETTARRAIRIDPTDGEQKPGDRGRAYAVLSAILEARGKHDDAAFFKRVVAAVQIAEDGDAFARVGLLRKSLALYEKASDLFVDAYCVQWRMAERLAAFGDHEGAKKHYEIAFERMPEQFGQVAQFCFGCEGVFTHQQSQSVAEEVLTKLEKSNPRKPQVQYLMGQLRESQGRKAEAYGYFRKASELDPQYLDAWKAAFDLRADVFLDQDTVDEIALFIIKQDPLLRHASIDKADIFDQKGLWLVYEQANKKPVLLPAQLMSLTGSKNEISAMLKKYGKNIDYYLYYYEERRKLYVEKRAIPEPGDTVSKNQFIQSMISYLLATSTGSQGW